MPPWHPTAGSMCHSDVSVIDGTIVKDGARYVLVHKDNSRPNLNLRVAFGDSPLGPWSASSDTFTEKFTEGPTVLKLAEDWLIYFDMYRADRYGAVKTRDFKSFTDMTSALSFPKAHKHGTVITITRAELDRLLQAEGAFVACGATYVGPATVRWTYASLLTGTLFGYALTFSVAYLVLGAVGSATWLDQGKPWAMFTLEEVNYNVDVSDYIRQRGQ